VWSVRKVEKIAARTGKKGTREEGKIRNLMWSEKQKQVKEPLPSMGGRGDPAREGEKALKDIKGCAVSRRQKNKGEHWRERQN